MPSEPVAIVYNDLADPRLAEQGLEAAPAHMIRDEIPLLEEILRRRGREVFTLPVGSEVLEAARELALRSPAVVFNLCEDLLGDSAHEMHFAALMELMGLRYTGSPPLTLGLCRDKPKTKRLMSEFGIPTPPFVVAESRHFALDDLEFPLIVKPAAEDGSLGIDDECVAADEETVRDKVTELLGYYDQVLVEEYVDGRELNVAVLGEDPPRVLPVSEIDFSGLPGDCPAICGYEAKWDEENDRYRTTVPVCPAELDPAVEHKIASFSTAAFRILGLRDYGRIDWRLSPTRGPQFLEANPNPDISPSSGFVRSLRAADLDYPEFVSFLLAAASERSGGG